MRFTLVLLVTFSLPFIAFAIWRLYRGNQAPNTPIHVLVIIGALLSVAAMIVIALTSIESGDSDGAYTPQSLEDGEIRPGRFEPDGELSLNLPGALNRL